MGCAGFTGSLCGGGSAANLVALAIAREAKQPANEGGERPCVVYASDNAAILERVIARRRVYLSNATIHGNFALRACFVNHRTKEHDVRAIVSEVVAAAREVGSAQYIV